MFKIMNKIVMCLLFLMLSATSYAQKFKSHIELNDRLMNSFLLCDRPVLASIAALYEERDILKYNEEYNQFAICSDKANEVALNNVVISKLNCSQAARIMLRYGLVCQLSNDAYEQNFENKEAQTLAVKEVDACLRQITTICDDFLIEKNIPKSN